MTVEKITSPITPNELINKTNEIIDNLGGGTDVEAFTAAEVLAIWEAN